MMTKAANPAPGYRKHPDHSITFENAETRVTARIGDLILADSNQAVLLRENRYSPVYYFPQSDVRMDLLADSAHSTYCPFKGQASYYNLQEGDLHIDNLVWSYATPYDESEQIREMVAFYGDKVTVAADS